MEPITAQQLQSIINEAATRSTYERNVAAALIAGHPLERAIEIADAARTAAIERV